MVATVKQRCNFNFYAHGLTANPDTLLDFSSDYEDLTPLPAPLDQLPSEQSVDGSNPSEGIIDSNGSQRKQGAVFYFVCSKWCSKLGLLPAL